MSATHADCDHPISFRASQALTMNQVTTQRLGVTCNRRMRRLSLAHFIVHNKA